MIITRVISHGVPCPVIKKNSYRYTPTTSNRIANVIAIAFSFVIVLSIESTTASGTVMITTHEYITVMNMITPIV